MEKTCVQCYSHKVFPISASIKRKDTQAVMRLKRSHSSWSLSSKVPKAKSWNSGDAFWGSPLGCHKMETRQSRSNKKSVLYRSELAYRQLRWMPYMVLYDTSMSDMKPLKDPKIFHVKAWNTSLPWTTVHHQLKQWHGRKHIDAIAWFLVVSSPQHTWKSPVPGNHLSLKHPLSIFARNIMSRHVTNNYLA